MTEAAEVQARPEPSIPAEKADAADAVRLIAHELRQPLSAIESIAYYVNLILPHEDRKAREQVAKLQRLVEQTNWILSNGLQFVQPVTPSADRLDMEEILSDATAGWGPEEPPLRRELAGDLPLVRMNPADAGRLFENLFTLFRQLVSGSDGITVRTSTLEGEVRVEIESATGGYRVESLPAGSGLSLRTARKIVHANGGRLDFDADPSRGVRVSVGWPAQGSRLG